MFPSFSERFLREPASLPAHSSPECTLHPPTRPPPGTRASRFPVTTSRVFGPQSRYERRSTIAYAWRTSALSSFTSSSSSSSGTANISRGSSSSSSLPASSSLSSSLPGGGAFCCRCRRQSFEAGGAEAVGGLRRERGAVGGADDGDDAAALEADPLRHGVEVRGTCARGERPRVDAEEILTVRHSLPEARRKRQRSLRLRRGERLVLFVPRGGAPAGQSNSPASYIPTHALQSPGEPSSAGEHPLQCDRIGAPIVAHLHPQRAAVAPRVDRLVEQPVLRPQLALLVARRRRTSRSSCRPPPRWRWRRRRRRPPRPSSWWCRCRRAAESRGSPRSCRSPRRGSCGPAARTRRASASPAASS